MGILGIIYSTPENCIQKLISEQRIVLIELIGIYEEQFKASVRADG